MRYNFAMAITTAHSIELSPALVRELQDRAEAEGRSVEAVLSDALHEYLEIDPKLRAISLVHRQKAEALGLTNDEYAVRLVKEVRAERRASE